jgi:hypothetical protein
MPVTHRFDRRACAPPTRFFDRSISARAKVCEIAATFASPECTGAGLLRARIAPHAPISRDFPSMQRFPQCRPTSRTTRQLSANYCNFCRISVICIGRTPKMRDCERSATVDGAIRRCRAAYASIQPGE